MAKRILCFLLTLVMVVGLLASCGDDPVTPTPDPDDECVTCVDEDENGTVEAQEAGMSGATVTLMQGGTVVTTAKSSADGRFELNMLRPGTYRVRIALPENALFIPSACQYIANASTSLSGLLAP